MDMYFQELLEERRDVFIEERQLELHGVNINLFPTYGWRIMWDVTESVKNVNQRV